MPKFITLTEQYQALFNKEIEKAILEADGEPDIQGHGQGTVRFIMHPELTFSVMKKDILNHPNFKDIVASQKDEEQKINDLKEMVIDIATEKIVQMETPGVTIQFSSDELQKSMNLFNMNFEDLLQSRGENMETQELGDNENGKI